MKRVILILVMSVFLIFLMNPNSLKATKEKSITDPETKRVLLKAEIDGMRAEIRENGYSFSVGINPAMQYDLEQLCSLNHELYLPSMHMKPAPDRSPELAPVAALPSSYVGVASSVKNQGSCGSCWAFAAVGLMESMILKKDGIELDLSEQQLVSCNPWGWGCNGGLWPNDMLVDPGAMMESCFPYTATDAPCNDSCPTPYHINGWAFVTADNVVPSVDEIKQAIYTYGAVQAGVYVDRYFQAYTGGRTAMFGQENTDGGANQEWDDIPVYEVKEGNSNIFTVRNEVVFGLLIESRPSTGFSWNIKDDHDKGIIRFLGVTEHEREEGDALRFGNSVFDKFVFRPCGSGEVTVHFYYSRPWEKDKIPEKEIRVVIRVRSE